MSSPVSASSDFVAISSPALQNAQPPPTPGTESWALAKTNKKALLAHGH